MVAQLHCIAAILTALSTNDKQANKKKIHNNLNKIKKWQLK